MYIVIIKYIAVSNLIFLRNSNWWNGIYVHEKKIHGGKPFKIWYTMQEKNSGKPFLWVIVHGQVPAEQILRPATRDKYFYWYFHSKMSVMKDRNWSEYTEKKTIIWMRYSVSLPVTYIFTNTDANCHFNKIYTKQ
jgi:hypothetical protein